MHATARVYFDAVVRQPKSAECIINDIDNNFTPILEDFYDKHGNTSSNIKFPTLTSNRLIWRFGRSSSSSSSAFASYELYEGS